MIDISYGILNYNPNFDKAALKNYIDAVDSLAKNRSNIFKSEVYLIDQASQPELTHQLAHKYRFNAVALSANVGISRGINYLANVARGEYISLVTSDVTFTPGLDETLVSALRSDCEIYQICPTSDNSSLDHQRADGPKLDGELIENITQELTIQFWPRTTFEKIGYFDERWKACYENMDYALRTFIDGGKTIIHTGAFCHHEHNSCTKNGSINHTYDGYLDIADGFSHEPLMRMWRTKWYGLDNFVSWNGLYKNIISDTSEIRKALLDTYMHNVYLPYVQDVVY